MKKTAKWLPALTLTLVIVMFAAAMCNSAFTAEGARVKLTKIEGKVEFRAPRGTTWAVAGEGASVAEGASVRTGADGKVFIAWKSGHTVKVHPLSDVTVSKLGAPAGGAEENSLSINKGKVFARAQKLTPGSSFTVRTPTAVAGVRGSGWETELAPDNSTSVSVVEGSVTLEAGGVEIVVDENMQSVVSSDEGAAPSEPEEIPESELTELQQDNTETEEAGAAAVFEEGAGEKEEEKSEEEKTEEKESEGGEAESAPVEAEAEGDADVTADIGAAVMEQAINAVIDKEIEQDNLQPVIIDTGAVELEIR